MKVYELTIVLPGMATAAKKKAVEKSIEKTIKTAGGRVVGTNDWGSIELAYPIKDNDSGVFIIFELELEPTSVKSLDQKIKLEEGIIRHLLISKEG